jgi:uncharacterized glyoxalase superfamily protein PhnB
MMVDANPKELGSAVIPVMRYRNLPAAIDWLCNAFGFERHRVTVGNNGAIQFAQLTFGAAMIMVGPVRASAFDKLLRQPDEVGGAETQVCYFFVADAQAHCARAKAAGAEIVFDIKHTANGGRSYSCRDPEGHLWNFGTYNPWQHQAIAQVVHDRQRHRLGIHSILVAGLLLSVAVVVAPLGRARNPIEQMPSEPAEIVTGSIDREEDPQSMFERRLARGEGAAAERAELAVQQQLTDVRLERDELQKAATKSQYELMQALSDRNAAERLAKEAQEKLVRALIAVNAAERAARDARRQLIRERATRAAVEGANQAKERPW